jgi:hypothetical protein
LPWLVAAEVTGASAAPVAAPPRESETGAAMRNDAGDARTAASTDSTSTGSAIGKLDASLIHTGIGPWGGIARAEAGADAGNSWSLGFEYSALAYMNMGRLTARYRHLYRIGGGQAGFDGGADVDVQVGGLWSVAEHQALVARVGARSYIYGNDRLFAALVEVPAAEAGYQLLSESWHLELLGRGGLVLVGKHRVLDAPKDDFGGTLMYGAGMALGWRALNAEVGWSAIGSDGHRLDMTGCAIGGKLGLCLELARLSTGVGSGDAAAASGDMPSDVAGEKTSQSITLWLSVGASERK